MDNVIFQTSDLANDRRRLLDTARAGRAIVRDKDGTGLVMLPEADLAVLEGYAKWSQLHQRLGYLLASSGKLSVAELGELAWLRVFDSEDQKSFADELHDSLIAGLADNDLTSVHDTVKDWRITARQLEDPLRRSTLLGPTDLGDFVEVEGPEA